MHEKQDIHQCPCECVHEHSQGHDHNHEHDHGHNHEHEHSLNHDHAHTHDHDHTEMLLGEVYVHEHEGAIVATLQDSFMASLDKTEQKMQQLIESLAYEIVKNGGVIGHIKASLVCADTTITFSATDINGVHVSHSSTQALSKSDMFTSADFTIVAIVFNLHAQLLQMLVAQSWAAANSSL